MSIPPEIRQKVQERAGYACEYCGVTEVDAGGELTVDHFRPQSRGGGNDLDNLIYACVGCNQFKGDYWPEEVAAPKLWNPREESGSQHFLEMGAGILLGLTKIGEHSIERLRLNRPALILNRRQKQKRKDYERLSSRYRDLLELINQLTEQYMALHNEQQELLELQQRLLRLLLKSEE